MIKRLHGWLRLPKAVAWALGAFVAFVVLSVANFSFGPVALHIADLSAVGGPSLQDRFGYSTTELYSFLELIGGSGRERFRNAPDVVASMVTTIPAAAQGCT